MLYSLKQETTYLLAFRRIDAFHILHQGVNSQHSRRESFQLWSLAMESKMRSLKHPSEYYFKKLQSDFSGEYKTWNEKHTFLVLKTWRTDSCRLLLNVCLIFQDLFNFFSTQETKKLYSWTYLLESNQARQFLKLRISIT